jgi:hypothetical protein
LKERCRAAQAQRRFPLVPIGHRLGSVKNGRPVVP